MTIQSQPVELVPGEVLDGKYQVERLLGVGGMGAVYVAKRLNLQDKVAIKSILSSQNTEVNRARFLREARAAASVRHPNVVKVFDFGEPRGRPPFMVMEYLAGPTLAAVVRDYSPMPLARTLWIFSGICAAVEAGHRRGVIHRDLKPGNVILSRGDDGRETVKVLDFGLARLLMETEVSALTSPGTMLGTCSYMSPELIESNLASAASDIYALGVILYEMLTGQSPFRAENNAATIWKITSGEYERPADLVPDLPHEVCAGIEAALARSPSDRPASPEELAARVGAPLAASASGGDPSAADRPRVVVAPGSSAGSDSGVMELSRPSMAPNPNAQPVASEVTTSDVGRNLEGGERTIPPIFRDGPVFSDVFVGRAAELDQLRREYRMSLDGRGRIVTVEGDAGVGKSRLLDAFGEWARSQGAGVLRGRFFAYEGDQPPPYETFKWMLAPTKTVGEPTRVEAPMMGPGGVHHQDPNQTSDKWRVFSRLTAGFAEQAHGRPLVVAVDDLQWGTALDLEFLAYLPRAIESTVMVIGTTRSSDHRRPNNDLEAWLSRLGSQRALSMLRLEGFSIGEVRAWFQACFPGIRVRPQDLRRLQHATSGNPYYLTEVVTQLVQTRRITRNAQGYSCVALDRVALPETVHSVVQAKLEGLGEELRKILETACVIGEEFRFEELQTALGAEEDHLETQLERAVSRHLLSEECRLPTSDYRFETTTLRSVLYDGLSRRRRRRLHRKVVDALLEIHGEDAPRIARRLSYHYHAVEDHEATLRWSLRAAADTLAYYDHDYAEICLRRAHDATETIASGGGTVHHHSKIELDRLTGLLYVRIGRLEEADEALQRALDTAELHAEDEGTAIQRLEITLILTGCQLGRGLLEVSMELGQMAIELAEGLGDRRGELEARLCTARASTALGQFDDSVLLLEPVIEDAEGPDLRPTRALAMAERASIYAKQGAFDKAYALASQALTLSRDSGDLQAEYRAISGLGQVHLEAADLTTAVEHIETALEMARSLSLRRREGIELHHLSMCEYQRGNPGPAESRAQEALAIFLEIKDLASEGVCRFNLGRIQLDPENPDEGLKMIEAGRELCATVGRRVYEGLALLELGLIHTRLGGLKEAHEQLGRASELFSRVDSLHLWRSELALAQLALAQGDRPHAATHARRAAQLVDILRSRLGHAFDQEAFTNSVSEVRDILDAVMR